MDINSGAEFQNRPEVEYPIDYDASLNGIGGWLVLIIIGRILSIILGIKGIFDIKVFIGYDIRMDIIAWSSIIFDLVIIVLSGLTLYYIFSRKIAFRKLLVIYVALAITFDIFIIIYTSSLGLGIKPDLFYLILDILIGAIWIPYFFLSKRIKNTYIYPKQYPHLY